MPSKKYNSGRRREKPDGDKDIVGIVLIIISAFILLCIIIRPILGFISLGIFNVITGVFGLFSYPLFFSTLILGIAMLQGRSSNISLRYKVGIICAAVSLMLILQLATSHSLLKSNFSAYISGVYALKTTAGGVLFGVLSYALSSLVSPVVAYVLLSLAFIASVGFFIILPLYSRRRKTFKEDENSQVNPFVKGLASPQQIKAVNDNTLFVDTIIPTRQDKLIQSDTQYTPIGSTGGEQIARANETQLSSANRQAKSGVQFESYHKGKNEVNDGYKAAREILFGNRQSIEPVAALPKVDYGKMKTEYEAKYSLPPVVSEPYVRDNTVKSPPPQSTVSAKPQKTVHNITDVGLAEIPMLPEKDYSAQIVRDGGEIINGEDLSRKIAEKIAPIQSDKIKDIPKASDFVTRKIDLPSVQPKQQLQTEDNRPSIVNGDYFGMPEKSYKSAAPAQPTNQSKQSVAQSLFESVTTDSSHDFLHTKKEEDLVQEPIITGTEYEKRLHEEAFFQQLEEERKSKAFTENADKLKDFEDNQDDDLSFKNDVFQELPVEEPEIEFFDDELPKQPRSQSSFNIIEEPVDMSEKTHLSGADNTGYYNSVTFDVKPSGKENKKVLNGQLKLDDYVNEQSPVAPVKPRKKKHARYKAPDIEMLIASDTFIPEGTNAACEEKARVLEETLQELKLPAKVNGITRGPAVTRFELEMPPGIPIKRIESLSTDIAYNLAANGKIRIEAPIPGKRAVGIEVPNEEIDVVRLREIIESKEFTGSSSPLTLALGKDIAGANIVCNLEKMPHLLIAGATGSGKSACLNSIIISMLYKSSPEDVRMILIDPKRVEFNMYQGIPHLMGSEIINDAQQAINVLTWAKEEMDRRYVLFGNHRVRNLPEYNKSEVVRSGEEQKLPYIVLIVDELAELMLDNNKKVIEGKIMSIAQKARAAGIHLILATQRPSVDVITGTIKANLPSRIAFTVKSIVDSRTILDECGAETLLGRGDMLYSPVGMDDPKRVQGAFVTDKEVLAISEFVRENNEADFDEEFATAIAKRNDEPESDGDEEEGDKEFDSLMPEVLKCVIESGSASTSMIQRRFSVGYARASRIIDQMELHKFIGPLEGSKPRAVYISREQYRELFGTDL